MTCKLALCQVGKIMKATRSPPETISADIKYGYVKNCCIFKTLPPERLQQVVDKLAEVHFAPGEEIVREGELGDRLFLLIKGDLATLKNMGEGQRELLPIAPGECFGEIAVITRGTRSATIKAQSSVTCLEMCAADFFQLLEEEPQLSQSLLFLLSQRLQLSEQAANRHLLSSYETLVFSLSDLTESRDPETGSHLNRVRDYCLYLAKEMANHPRYAGEITPLFFESIAVAAPLHDIGKVAIPDHILLKPGKLSPDEFAVMKTHTWMGANTLLKVVEQCNFPVFQVGYNIIHYHHERYDGTGYPAGLRRDEIPLEARIMALADVFDALLSRRPYKEPFTYEETWQIIAQEKGRHFDPDLVDAALRKRNKLNEIHRHYRD